MWLLRVDILYKAYTFTKVSTTYMNTNTNENKSAEQLKAEAFWKSFGCTEREFAKGMAEARKQIAEYVKTNYPNAK